MTLDESAGRGIAPTILCPSYEKGGECQCPLVSWRHVKGCCRPVGTVTRHPSCRRPIVCGHGLSLEEIVEERPEGEPATPSEFDTDQILENYLRAEDPSAVRVSRELLLELRRRRSSDGSVEYEQAARADGEDKWKGIPLIVDQSLEGMDFLIEERRT